jgi:predicted DCC family thiol-disulfide oxidoreductase YuxK
MDRHRDIFVKERPAGPWLVYDGECRFCRQWMARWQGITGDRVVYRASQEVADQFPEIGAKGFQAKVWLIEPDGRASGGARAVFRLYALAGEKRWLDRMYETLPAFAGASERVYGLVARHREAAAVATRWLWGDVASRPRYRRMRAIFLRALGLVYLAAFLSLAVQVDGLIGRGGILPAAEFLEDCRRAIGTDAYRQFPTLLWWDCSDRSLHVLCWGGVALSSLLIVGILPGECLALLWLFYLSLTTVGQEFLSFQWDILLLESGLLAILFAPWGLWIDWAKWEPSRGVIWLIRWLVFRLMFLSGVVKLSSGDKAWWTWEAMKYHYETQPLPTSTSWYMHQLPAWSQRASVGAMFYAELIVPFFVFGPRRIRMVGFWSILLLQVLIAATGNYGFFNLLSAVLCLALVEDRDWGRKYGEVPEAPRAPALRGAVVGFVGTVVVLVTAMVGLDRAGSSIPYPGPLEALRRWVDPLRSMNAYGLFAVMTTERPEIIIEGSDDGQAWRPYRFRWKPQEPDRRPRFTTPHMPRLDWQMWFAALYPDCRHQPWFVRFEQRLLEGSPSVLDLLRENPFPDRSPRYVRARLFRYQFTERGAKDWWKRQEVGLYCPPIRL